MARCGRFKGLQTAERATACATSWTHGSPACARAHAHGLQAPFLSCGSPESHEKSPTLGPESWKGHSLCHQPSDCSFSFTSHSSSELQKPERQLKTVKKALRTASKVIDIFQKAA